MKFFDTHAHYTDSRFTEEFEGGVDALLKEVFASDVKYIVNTATNNENTLEVAKMAAKYDNMFATAGIHPEDCLHLTGDVDSEIKVLAFLLDRKDELKIVALGEIGLDYYWDQEHKELQKEYFNRQLELACDYALPVVIHDREAHGDVFETLIKYPNLKGVLHSFSGSPEMALELIKRGWYISFSGVVSFKNSRKTKEVAASIPRDRILIETDAPYLAPHPMRGKLNRSDYLPFTLKAIAEARDEDEETLAEAIFANSLNFFDK